MKKLNLYFIAFAIIVFASCEKDSDDDKKPDEDVTTDFTVDFNLKGYTGGSEAKNGFVFITNDTGQYSMEAYYLHDTSFSSTFPVEDDEYNLHLGYYYANILRDGGRQMVLEINSYYDLSVSEISRDALGVNKNSNQTTKVIVNNVPDGFTILDINDCCRVEQSSGTYEISYYGTLPFVLDLFNISTKQHFAYTIDKDVTIDASQTTFGELNFTRTDFSNVKDVSYGTHFIAYKLSPESNGCIMSSIQELDKVNGYVDQPIFPANEVDFHHISLSDDFGKSWYNSVKDEIITNFEKIAEDIIITNGSSKSFELEIPEGISFWRTSWVIEKDKCLVGWDITCPASNNKIVVPEIPEKIKAELGLSESDVLKLNRVSLIHTVPYTNQDDYFKEEYTNTRVFTTEKYFSKRF